jgi:hypothetical protein
MDLCKDRRIDLSEEFLEPGADKRLREAAGRVSGVRVHHGGLAVTSGVAQCCGHFCVICRIGSPHSKQWGAAPLPM